MKQRISDEVLWGAAAIADYTFGDAGPRARKRVYNAADRQGLPTFKVGKLVCAKRSALDRWINEKAGELDG